MNNIDPNTVYISFTGKDKEIVERFVGMLKENNIPYRVSIEEDIDSISEFEEEIGKGMIVVIFYSPDYFKSYHCMNEYALTRTINNGKRVFTYKCRDCNFEEIKKDLKRHWGGEKAVYGDEVYEELTAAQQAAYKNEFYIEKDTHKDKYEISIFRLANYFRNKQYKNNLETLLECVQGKITEIPESSKPHIASIDDIDFNQINFQYNRPTAINGEEKEFFGRKEFVKNMLERFNNNENCLNVVATGGMGKTSVAHIYIREYKSEYDKIEFLVSNDNICADCVRELRGCITSLCPDYELLLRRDNSTQKQAINQIDRVLSRASKKCLLVVDVNVTDENNDYLLAPDFSDQMKANWHILYLSRQKIARTKSIQLSNFEDDLDGAKGLFNSIYANDWDDEKLDALFKLVYYHPLLIEHLAAYGIRGQNRKTYQQLCDVVSENRIKNATINKSYSEFSTCFIDKEKTKDVCVYLSQLFDINDYDKNEQYIMQHFILWPYDYISIDTVNLLLKTDEINDWEGTLIGLTDKVVFSQSSKGYRMHGLLVDTLKSEKLDFDYSKYIANVKSLLSFGGEEIDVKFSDTYQCIFNTPWNIFVIEATKDYSVYEDWKFLRKLAQLKKFDTELSELSYKAYLLKVLYNNSGEEIYNKVYGEYKNVSSHLIYYNWFDNRNKYKLTLPPAQKDNGITYISFEVQGVKFKMIKVRGGSFMINYDSETTPQKVTLDDFYIAETQVTNALWATIMKDTYSDNYEQYPVQSVSWYDCISFIMKLNETIGLCFRLPTEAEWEFAARCGGQNFKYSWDKKAQRGGLFAKKEEKRLKDFAWFGDNMMGGEGTHPVATVRPNELGIYDMSGNVWEWCQDWYAEDYYKKCKDDIFFSKNPQGPISGSDRVLRGGAYGCTAQECRVSYRSYSCPDDTPRFVDHGFRLALSSPKK